jgi:hypothetical protein
MAQSQGGQAVSDHIGDTNKMISDTPRMKAAQMAALEHMTGDVWRVGCDLERELNAANQIIHQQQLLDEENLRLQERIKRLEEAGDMMVSHAKALGMDGTGLVKRWFKTKEAKP